MAALPLMECIKIKGIKDGSLFQKNVRQSLGISNVVNKKIKKTILGDKCPEFFFYHNGITAICNKIIEQDNDTIDLKGLSVVNGCQSLNTILSCSETVKKQDEAYVLFRFYEIPQRDRADNISINTNTQSAVKARDLRSNDEMVLRLKKAYEQEYPNGTPVETGDDGYQHFIVTIPSSFDNQTVYIGFRHFNCTDQFYLNIDDVIISDGSPVIGNAPAAAPGRAALQEVAGHAVRKRLLDVQALTPVSPKPAVFRKDR